MSKIRKENGLVVLSLFDGMSCGRLALEKAGIKVDKYLASEIKPFAIKHTLDKFPDTVSLGDVTKLHYDTKTKTLLANCTRETIDKIGVKEDLDVKDFPTKKDLEDKGLDIIDGKVCKVKFTDEELANFDKLGYELEDASGEVIKWTGGDPKYVGDIDLLIGGSPCFTGDTLVLMEDGSYKKIKEINVGEKIQYKGMSYNVLNWWNQGVKEVITLTFDDGFNVTCTPNHKFLCKTGNDLNEWVEAKDLKRDKRLVLQNNGDTKIVVDITDSEQEEVFDIEVETIHCFVLENGSIVHNCQDFSTANSFGKGAYGLQGPKSRLFYEYNRLRHEVNPNFYLLENVKMRKDSEARLNDYMEVNGTHVNGALVSPTNRPRVYWTNIYDGNPIPQPTDLKISFQDYKLQTLPNIERMLYMEKYPMCYELFDASMQKELDPYVEKDETGKVIKGVVTITEDDIAKICAIPSNIWARKELEEAYGHTLSDKEFVDELHAILQEAYVKKSPSRDKMYKGDAKGRFKCKDITNEEKMSCITRKQDRFPNAGLITIGDGLYCRFVTKLEMCKGQSIPYSFVNTLSYTNISDILGDGWQRDIIAHIFEGLKDKYDF